MHNNKKLEILRTYSPILYDYYYETNLGNLIITKIGLVFPVNGDLW